MTKKRRAGLWILGAVGAAAFFLYLVLPALVLRKLNRRLADLELYQGHVEAVTLHLFHAGLGLKKLTLVVRGTKAPVPLIAVDDIDLCYSWKALLHGGFVGTAVIVRPVIHYVMPPKGAPQVTQRVAEASVKKAKSQGYAYISRAEVKDGRIEIEDDEVKPGYTIFLKDFRGQAYNIGSKPGLTKERTTAAATAVVMDSGAFKGDLAADAMAEKPTFEYAVSMRGVALPQFNDWIRHYLFIEARGGSLDFDSEAKCVDGRIDGYVKPLIVGLQAVDVKGGKDIGKQLKGEVEKMTTEIFRNPSKNQIGTQVSFSGDLGKPKIKIFPAVVELVRNAFVKAISPGLRGVVDFKAFMTGKKG